jgi:hypothetical protein
MQQRLLTACTHLSLQEGAAVQVQDTEIVEKSANVFVVAFFALTDQPRSFLPETVTRYRVVEPSAETRTLRLCKAQPTGPPQPAGVVRHMSPSCYSTAPDFALCRRAKGRVAPCSGCTNRSMARWKTLCRPDLRRPGGLYGKV